MKLHAVVVTCCYFSVDQCGGPLEGLKTILSENYVSVNLNQIGGNVNKVFHIKFKESLTMWNSRAFLSVAGMITVNVFMLE